MAFFRELSKEDFARTVESYFKRAYKHGRAGGFGEYLTKKTYKFYISLGCLWMKKAKTYADLIKRSYVIFDSFQSSSEVYSSSLFMDKEFQKTFIGHFINLIEGNIPLVAKDKEDLKSILKNMNFKIKIHKTKERLEEVEVRKGIWPIRWTAIEQVPTESKYSKSTQEILFDLKVIYASI